MKVNVDEDWFTSAMAEDLLWSAENAEHPRDQKALLRAAFYYMTGNQIRQYLGSNAAAEEYWGEY